MSASSSPIFTWSRRVEFAETDAAGIVHFSSFFLYMEQAEHALFRSLGLSIFCKRPKSTSESPRSATSPSAPTDSVEPSQSWASIELDSVSWPRVHCSCDFHSPAYFEDELSIDLFIERLGSKSLTYKHSIRRGQDVLAIGRVTSVCSRVDPVSNRLASCPIPDFIRQKFQSLIESSVSTSTTNQPPTNL
ncbi:MAG: acyl-CoA thioesterase [Planctomycetota bacterium]|jgi:acyl-CoA thioester hydrolase